MSDIDKTIEGIREKYAFDCRDSSCRYATDRSGMRTNGGCRCYSSNRYRQYVAEIEHLCESLQAENAELREALEHYADKKNWSCELCADPDREFECKPSDHELRIYQGSTHGYEHAQAVLDKHKREAK